MDDGTVVEVAVVDVVDGVAEDLTLVGFAEDGSVDIGERGSSDDEEFSVEVGGFEEFGQPGDFMIAGAIGEFGIKSWSDNGDAGAGFEQAGDFGSGDRTATDNENGAVVEF